MTQFEANASLNLRTEVRESSLPDAGRGVFTLDAAAAGTFLGLDFCSSEMVRTEAEVLALPVDIRMFSWRHVEHVCFEAIPGPRVAADLMNHSFEPNIHWHLGFYFAAVDIEEGDELLLDYRHLLSPLWNDRLFDAATGRPVNGFEWRESILESCRKTIEILERTAPKNSVPDGD